MKTLGPQLVPTGRPTLRKDTYTVAPPKEARCTPSPARSPRSAGGTAPPRGTAPLQSRPGAQQASWSLRTAGMTDWTSRNFARWLFEDYPRAVLGTPGRWRRDLFTQPGAFA